jgi:ubiquinone/menaquinone biosynthesis C-methylase UbiE
MANEQVKQEVQKFYDQVGWQLVEGGVYQNARYEDLRPVSKDYIHRCHMRVKQFLKPSGRFLLDAGSGPVQYPEYLTYSKDYQRRVCVDISLVALLEARKRLGEHGFFVVADVSHLPFKKEAFDGVVSLHTLHHLPSEDQIKAYEDLYRVLANDSSAVIVNGWTESKMMKNSQWLVNLMEGLGRRVAQRRGKAVEVKKAVEKKQDPTGTFIAKIDADWLRSQLNGKMAIDIRCWRSVSVRYLRAVVHRQLGGGLFLKFLFWLEERFPKYFGENGQYPLIIIRK